MRTEQFCQVLDQELDDLLEEFQEDEVLRMLKSPEQKKSYAFLIWFLRFYGSTQILFREAITEGNDDSSCDIILVKPNLDNRDCFYIVQSKWRKNPRKSEGIADDIKKALSDFDTILQGSRKPGKNAKFNEQYAKLKDHLARNGEVKFVFLMLAPYQANIRKNIEDNIRSFKNNHPTVRDVEIIDLERLKYDFIDKRYKRIQPDNPLDDPHNPENAEIILDIERISNETEQGDYIRVSKPFESYMFFIRPKIVFELFDKYGFHLFAQNIRNPLPESNYNQKIVETMTHKPGSFWYFNNGISAITRILPKGIARTATRISITGLQVINGAQTVYSIYRAYKEADGVTRQEMDDAALVSIRLIKTNDPDMNRQITLYTNSQNRIFDRDFHANDEMQVRLQRESFQTCIWYERRRGEFDYANLPEKIEVVSNEIFAHCYLSYHLEQCLFTIPTQEKDKNFLFISRKSHEHGLYEKIFSEDTRFVDMLAGLYVYRTCCTLFEWEEDRFPVLFLETGLKIPTPAVFIMPLFKVISKKYAEKKKVPEMRDLTSWIIKTYEADADLPKQLIIFIHELFEGFDEKNIRRALHSPTYFDMLRLKIEDDEINIDGIDAIDLDAFTHLQVAQAHYHDEEYDEAILECDASIALQPESFSAWDLKADALVKLDRYADAEQSYHKALSIKPAHEDVWYKLGTVLQNQEKYIEAETAHRKQIDLKNNHENAWLGLGIALGEQQKYTEAEAAFSKQLEFYPKHKFARIGLGLTFRDQEKYTDAEAAFREQLEYWPDDQIASRELGLVLGMQEKYAEAEAVFRKQLELNPDNEDAWANLELTLQAQQKHCELETAYRRQLDSNPEHENAWDDLGDTLYHQKKYSEAEASYRNQLKITPEHKHAWKGLGVVLWKQDKLEDATEAFFEHLKLQPQDLSTLCNDTELALVQGDTPRCRERIKTALPLLSPQNQEYAILPFLAWLSEPTQDIEPVIAAIEEIDAATELTWDFSEIRPAIERLDEKNRAKADLLVAFFEEKIEWAQVRRQLSVG